MTGSICSMVESLTVHKALTPEHHDILSVNSPFRSQSSTIGKHALCLVCRYKHTRMDLYDNSL